MYIGNDLQVAESGNKIIDDISSSFNGSTTSFALLVGGAAPVPFPINTQQIYISVNGVIQEPDPTGSAGFKLLGNNIVFSSAPANGHAFFGVILSGADYVTVGTEFPAGSATAPSITFGNDNNTGLYSVTGGTMGFTSDGVQTFTLDGDGFKLPDNKKLLVGSSSDLELFHDGSHSYIKDTGTGRLKILTNYLDVENAAGTENLIHAEEDGAVELNYNGTKRFETSNTGTNVIGIHVDDGATHDGDVTFTGAAANVTWDKSEDDLIFADNAKAAFGTSSDLALYHDGSDSWIRDTGTGRLLIDGSEVHIRKYGAAETMAKFIEDGAVELYHNNVKKLETTSYGLLSSNQVRINSSNATTVGFSCGDAGTGFYNSGSNAIGYSANGTQKWNIDSGGSLTLVDNVKATFGTSSDLQIYHDGSNSFLAHIDAAPGDLYLDSQNAAIVLRSGDGSSGVETAIQCLNNGAVELYHSGTKQAETYAGGFQMHKEGYIKGAEANDANLYMYADEGDDPADKWKLNAAAAGGWFLENNASGSWEANLKAVGNGGVELYHNNNKKLETSTYGTTLTGNLFLADSSDGNWGRIKVGTGEDLQIYHDGSHSYIKDTGTGNLYLCGSIVDITNAAESEFQARFIENSSVELYYDGVKKFETTANGIEVEGNGTGAVIANFKAALGSNNRNLSIKSPASDSTTVPFLFSTSNSIGFEVDNVECLRIGAADDVSLPNDNSKLTFGASQDLQIYHDGNNSYIDDTGTGSLILKSSRVSFNDTSNNENARLDSDGLKFNGDSAAANALDDYEEGTWTVGNVSGLGGTNVSVNMAWYTKIGRTVTISLNIFSSDNNMSTGGVTLSGLPFTVQDHQGIFLGGYNNKDSSGVYINSTNIVIMSGATGVRHVWTTFTYTI